MPPEDFSSRYQVLDQIADGPVRSYHALAHSGVVVMLHFFPPESGEHASLLERLRRLPRAPEGMVMEVTESDGEPVVVTRFILDFDTLPAWLAEAEGEPGPQPAHPSEPEAPAASDEPGEFTGMFKRPELPESPRPPREDPPPAPPDPPPSPADPPAEAPGEFTRMFKRPELPPEAEHEATRSPEPPKPEPPKPEPPRPEPPRPDPPRPPEPPTRPAPPAPPPRSSEPPAPPPSPPREGDSGPGHFTREMQKLSRSEPPRSGGSSRPVGPPSAPALGEGDAPSPPRPPSPPKRPAGGAPGGAAPPPDFRDRLYTGEEGAPVDRPGGLRANLPREQGPSEFTRVIKQPSMGGARGGRPGRSGPAVPPDAPPVGHHPPPSAKPIWPLVLGLVLVVLAAVGVVVYFVLSAGGGE